MKKCPFRIYQDTGVGTTVLENCVGKDCAAYVVIFTDGVSVVAPNYKKVFVESEKKEYCRCLMMPQCEWQEV